MALADDSNEPSVCRHLLCFPFSHDHHLILFFNLPLFWVMFTCVPEWSVLYVALPSLPVARLLTSSYYDSLLLFSHCAKTLPLASGVFF